MRAVLHAPDQARLAQLAGSIQLAVPEYQEHHTPHLAPMQLAIAGRQVLELGYRDKQSHDTRRRVEPIGLVFYNFTWHLVAWCQLRQAYRQFRVSRVQQLTVTTLPFTNPAPLSLADYLTSLNLPPQSNFSAGRNRLP